MTSRNICIAILGMLLPILLHPAVAVAEFGWNAIEIHGFLSQGYMASSGNNIFAGTLDGTFQFNEFGLNFSTDLSERLHVGLQYFSRDIGDFGNNDIKLDWAYADYRWNDWLGLRAGRIKFPSGLYMETIDLDLLRTCIFLPQSIYDESMRDIFIAVNGLGLYGYLPLGRTGDLAYHVAYGTIGLSTDGTMALYMESEATARLIDVEDRPVLRAHVEWMPSLEGIRITGSFTQTDIHLRYATTADTYWATEAGLPVGSEFPHNMENTTMLSGGLEVIRDRITLLAEYEYMQTDVVESAEDTARYRSAGYYAGLTYQLTDRWALGTYYSVYYDDLNDRDGRKFAADTGLPRHRLWQNDWTVSTRFDVNEHWLIKAELHLIDGTASFLNQHNPDGTERKSTLFAVKTTYNF